jgi:lipoprotein-releasing system ATP-binding protein
MSDYKLEAKSLSKSYKNGVNRLDVLKNIDISVKKNEFLSVQGPSGAGKSTLLHILGGLDTPTAGEVIFDGASIYGLTENERAVLRNRKIGFVFQFYHLLPELSALENVYLPALLKSWSKKKQAMDYARWLLNSLGLADRMRHRPNELSGGEQQRVAIARGLINKPQVLLCDEPTGNLDSENGQIILKLLRRLNHENEVSIILVTHDKDIAKVADRVVHLKDGIILN